MRLPDSLPMTAFVLARKSRDKCLAVGIKLGEEPETYVPVGAQIGHRFRAAREKRPFKTGAPVMNLWAGSDSGPPRQKNTSRTCFKAGCSQLG